MDIMQFIQLMVIAVLVEAIWENLKMVYDKNKINVSMIGCLLLGMIICVLGRLDIFKMVGLELYIPVVGSLLTGIICSRGANALHDLLKRIKSIKEG